MKRTLTMIAILLVMIVASAQTENDTTKKSKNPVMEKIMLDRTFNISDNAILFTNKRTGHNTAHQSWSEDTHVRMEIYANGEKAYYVEDDMFIHLMIIPLQGTYSIIMNSTLKKK